MRGIIHEEFLLLFLSKIFIFITNCNKKRTLYVDKNARHIEPFILLYLSYSVCKFFWAVIKMNSTANSTTLSPLLSGAADLARKIAAWKARTNVVEEGTIPSAMDVSMARIKGGENFCGS